jgi:4-amino-4-deoxy-L-arabinose transferase-like glycosyltransferase
MGRRRSRGRTEDAPPARQAPTALSDRRFRIALLLIGGGAMAVRAIHALSILGPPLSGVLVEDAAYYHLAARRILGLVGGAAGSGPSFMNLGLPYALAAIYTIFGPHVRSALAVQAVAGSLSSVAVAVAAASLTGDRRAGIWAGALYALAVPAIFYDALVLTPSLVNAALAAALALLAAPAGPTPRWRLLAGGLAVGAAALLRANLLLAIPLVAAAVYLRKAGESGTTRTGRMVATSLFASAAVALPVAVIASNGLAHGAWVPVSSNGGMNFYVGNGPGATGVYAPAPFLDEVNPAAEVTGFLAEARRRTDDPSLSPAEASRFWFRAGLSAIARSPAAWLGLEGRKFVLFWNGFEVNTNVGLGFVRRFSPLLRFDPVGYGLLAILGAPGLALLALRRPRRALLPIAIATTAFLTVVLFFVSGEYRHPASLALAIGAGVVVAEAVRALAGRGLPPRREAWVAVAAFAAVAPMALWRFAPLEAGCAPRYDFANVAREIATPHPGGPPIDDAAYARAIELLNAAPDSDSDLVVLDSRAAIATAAAAATGERAWAARALGDLAALATHDLTPGQGGYSDAFYRSAAEGLVRRAAQLFAMDAVRRDPALSREAELIGGDRWRRMDALLRSGDVSGAEAFVTEALRHAPYDTDLQAERGRVFLHEGNEREGLAWLTRSCAGWPETPRCALYGAYWYASRGHAAEAATFAREALRREPQSVPARSLLERLSH